MTTNQFYQVLFVLLIAFGSFDANAQDPSSILDLESTSQGLLAPRMTTAERTAIATPAQSLMVYDTNTKSFWYYKDSAWNELGAGGASPWLPNGNGINYNAGGVGIGTLPLSSSPSLNVVGEINFAQPGSRSFIMPGWAPSPAKQVIAGVFTGEGINAPVIRHYAPNGKFTDVGVDTLGNYILELDDVTQMTVLQNGNVGIGTTADALNPAEKLVVQSSVVNSGAGVISATYTANSSSDRAAVRAISIPTPGYGYGVYADGGYIGVYGRAQATTYGFTAYGGYFDASGSAGTRTGIYASASGGTTNNWAGYFAGGNVYVANDMLIGTQTRATGYKVSVDGKIACEEVLVDMNGDWPDYVFNADYELKTLNEVKQYIAEKGHLPGVPSAQEIEDNGIVLGEMNKVLMEKIEELTLYILQQEEKHEVLRSQMLDQQIKLNAQDDRLKTLESNKK